MKIGIYGGSFDPIHNGHLMLAENARVELKLDMVIFVPCYISAYKYKKETLSFNYRYWMIDKALKHNYYMTVSNIEHRKNPSYTIDTIKRFKELYPKDELYLINGPDAMKTFHTWRDYKHIEKYCKVVYGGLDFFCPKIEIRSTLIRQMIKENRPIRYLVPDTVNKYIKEKKLYVEN